MSTRSVAIRIASPLIASIFIRGGLDSAMHPEGKIKKAEKVIGPLARSVTALPDDTETLVRLNGVTQVIAGATLSLGILRRASAAVLIGTLVPTTLAGHAFWEELDEDARTIQAMQFAKNLGLLGGLLLIATGSRSRRSSRQKGKSRLPARRGRRGSDGADQSS